MELKIWGLTKFTMTFESSEAKNELPATAQSIDFTINDSP